MRIILKVIKILLPVSLTLLVFLAAQHLLVLPQTDAPKAQQVRQLPRSLIIGVKKCGTRALLEMLRLHSQVAGCTQEVHFFDKDENYNRGFEWYRQQMPPSSAGQLTIEKSPSYFITPTAPERIHQMNPDIKLLITVRDPITRLLSDYSQLSINKQRNGKAVLPIESLLIVDGELNMKYVPILVCLYNQHLQRWLQYFPLENIHVVDMDGLVSNPVLELKKVEKFLNLKPMINDSQFFLDRTTGYWCWKNFGKDICLSENKHRAHPDLDPHVLQKLIDFFKEPNRMFFETVGRTFNWTR